MRTIRNVFVRVDVVLGAQWLSNDEVLLYPMVNEMDWLNSAGMLATFWKEPAAESDDAKDLHSARSAIRKSNGFKIARALYEEALYVWQQADVSHSTSEV